jgi:glycosyltransferase involved in cell wall biosynthesis
LNEKISVIVPIYNVEKYLSECIDSILNQRYANIEIILVDDGSLDSCSIICDNYAKIDNRIKVVHQKNIGAGGAKNVGIDIATGKYIAFVDGDDYIDSEMYSCMFKYMKDDVDIVQCNLRMFFRDGIKETQRNYGSFKTEKALCNLLVDWRNNVFYNKLFRRDVIQNIRFPIGRAIDDEFFTYKTICKAKQVIYIDNYFYNYRMRKSSIMNGVKKQRLDFDRIDYLIERYEYIKKEYPKIEKKFKEHLLIYFSIIKRENLEDPNIISKIDKYIKDNSLEAIVGIKAKIKSKLKNIFANKIGKTDAQENFIKFD